MPTQTEEQRQRALRDAGVLPVSLPPSVSSSLQQPIDASTLSGGTTPFTLPPAPALPSHDISIIPTIEQVQANATASASAPQTPAERTQATLSDRLLSAYQKLTGKSAAQQTADAAAGLPGYQKQLSDISAQIQTLQKEAEAASIKSEDRLAPTFAIRGEQAQIERQRSIKALGLSAVAQTLQGNVALAQDQANRAVELEFGPVQAEIDYLSKALEINKNALDREDAKRAENLQLQLQERQRLLDQQKADRQDVMDIATAAAQNGADSTTINRILTASDPATALNIGSRALGEPFRQQLQQQQFENEIVRRETQLKEQASDGNQATAVAADNVVQALGSNKISAGTKTSIATILGVINAAETFAKNNASGEIPGFYPGRSIVDFLTPNAFKRDSTIKNEGFIDAINLKVQQWASGASLTKEQIEQVNKLVPGKNDSDRQVKTKLNNLVNFMNLQIKGSLAAEGVIYDPPEVDLWNQQQTLADIFK